MPAPGDEPDLFGGLPAQPAPAPRTRVKTPPPAPPVPAAAEPAPAASVIDPGHSPDLSDIPETTEEWFKAAGMRGPGNCYSGTCIGGPRNGQMLHHPEPLFRFAEREGRVILWAGPIEPGITFHWYQFVGGDWTFIESEQGNETNRSDGPERGVPGTANR